MIGRSGWRWGLLLLAMTGMSAGCGGQYSHGAAGNENNLLFQITAGADNGLSGRASLHQNYNNTVTILFMNNTGVQIGDAEAPAPTDGDRYTAVGQLNGNNITVTGGSQNTFAGNASITGADTGTIFISH